MIDNDGGIVLVRGGGDLGTGVALALHRSGRRVAIVDLRRPTTLRLRAALAAAALSGDAEVAGVRAVHVRLIEELSSTLDAGVIPLWTGDEAPLRSALPIIALVDARLRGLSQPRLSIADAETVIALGPGYVAGRDCHFVIETHRGPRLGQVISDGQSAPHTGQPGAILGHTEARVLRAPAAGVLRRRAELGEMVEPGFVVAEVAGRPLRCVIGGMLRGLKLDGVFVQAGQKVGDVDPRGDIRFLRQPSDKADRVGAGVVEAMARSRKRRDERI